MKTFSRIISGVAVAATIILGTASAQADSPLRFGLKVGANVNEMKFDSSILSADNTAGFTAGVTAVFKLPVFGLGIDASAMYTRRNGKFSFEGLAEDAVSLITKTENNNRDYIEVPINLRWHIPVPIISQYVSPYLYTGPDFSFLTSKTKINEIFKNKTFDMAWNVGLGFRIIDRVEIAASYGFGITDSASGDDALYKKVNFKDPKSLNSKNNFWTITAAYLF